MEANISLENLWQLVQSLSTDKQRWLADHIYEHIGQGEEERPLPPYTMEELNTWLDEAEADFQAGKGVPADEVHRKMERILAEL